MPAAPTDPGSSPTSAELEASIMTVARGLRRGWAESIAHTGLAPHQARALRVIGVDGPIRPGVLAERLRVTPRSVTEVVDALIHRDLVDRQVDPRDRRAMVLTLTPAGHELAEQVRACRTAHTERVFADALTADEERLLIDLLGRLADRLC